MKELADAPADALQNHPGSLTLFLSWQLAFHHASTERGTHRKTREKATSAPSPRDPIDPEPKKTSVGIPNYLFRNRRLLHGNSQQHELD